MSGLVLTRCWREMDSNLRFPRTECGPVEPMHQVVSVSVRAVRSARAESEASPQQQRASVEDL